MKASRFFLGFLGLLVAPTAQAAQTPRHFSVAAGSSVSYVVHVKTLVFLNETIEGINREVSGRFTLDGNGSQGWFEAPVSAFASGIKGRDKNVAEILGAPEFKTVRFDLWRMDGFNPTLGAGKATAVGQLSAHGQSHPLSVPVAYQLVGDRLSVIGTAPLRFSDYALSAPVLGFVVKRAPDVFSMRFAITATEDRGPALTKE